MKHLPIALLLLLVHGNLAANEPVDSLGGWMTQTLAPAAHMRLEQQAGAWWLVTPAGHPFIGIALAHGNRPPPARRLPEDRTDALFGNSLSAFVSDREQWMRHAGYNAFSYTTPEDAGVPFPWIATINLLPAFISKGADSPDFYSADWRDSAAAVIARDAAVLAADPRVIGICLGYPVLASPHMVPEWMWSRRNEAPTNLLKTLKSRPGTSPGKQAYITFLENRHVDVTTCCTVYGWSPASSWEELADRDLGAEDDPWVLRPEDAPFYEQLWRDTAGFLAGKLRAAAPGVIVFSPRIIGLRKWPDPWVETWFRGVGPAVDAFLPELYGSNPAREIIDRIGDLTGRPSFIADGMRRQEFNYPGEATDEQEAAAYETLFRSLIGSPWFLGCTTCEYHTQRSEFPWYARLPEIGRLGLRQADYSDRPALLATLRRLHAKKYELRAAALLQKTPTPDAPSFRP